MLEKYQNRDSRFELLRLISILSIVYYHLLIHSFGETFPHNFYWDILTIVFHIGVICFILISGYFSIRLSLKGIIRIVIQCLLYSIIIYAFSLTINYPEVKISLFSAVTPLLHEEWWFMTSYFILYLLSPYINKLWSILSDLEKKKLLCLLGLVIFYFGWIGNISTIHQGRDILSFVFIYYLGAYLKTNGIFWNYKKAYLFIILFIVIGAILGFKYPIIGKIVRFSCFGYNSPGLIIMATSFFMFFAQFKEFTSTIINYCAASVLPIYYLHENFITYPIMQKIASLEYNHFFIIISLFITAICICFFCMILDKVLFLFYSKIEKVIENISIHFLKLFDRFL